jgi:hypothetical protein
MAQINNMQDAQQALNAGQISQDEFDNYQQQFAIKTSNTNDIATNMGLSEKSPLLASNNPPPAPGVVSQSSGSSSDGGFLSPIKDFFKKAVDTAVPQGTYQQNVGTTTPTFDPSAIGTLTGRQALEGNADTLGSAKASQEAVANIGKITENVLSKPAQQAMGAAGNVMSEAAKNFANIKAANDNAISAANDAMSAIQLQASKATIDPNRYVKDLGVGGATALGILAVLGGNGGKPVVDNLNRNIDRDIAAQQQTYLNLAGVGQAYQQLATTDVNIAAVTTASRSAAAISVLSGASALIQNAMTQVQAKTAVARGTVIQGQIQNELLNQQIKFDELRKGLVTTGDASTLNMVAEFLKRAGGIGQVGGQNPIRQDQPQGQKTYEAPSGIGQTVNKIKGYVDAIKQQQKPSSNIDMNLPQKTMIQKNTPGSGDFGE